MAEKTKQHYVPKFYLKNFTNRKLFNIYNCKSHMSFYGVPFVNQCYKNNFYGEDKLIENKLADLETKWSLAIRNVLLNHDRISAKDKNLIKQFCCFQYLRTEKAAQNAKFLLVDAYRKMIPIALQFYRKSATKSQVDNIVQKYAKDFDFKKMIGLHFKIAKKNFKYFKTLKIKILHNETEKEFVTSDNPIIIGNEFQNENGLGINCMGAYFLFPISSKLYILVYDYKIYTSINKTLQINLTEKDVQNLNILQYENCLENVFSVSKYGIDSIKFYVDTRCDKVRRLLLNEYNRSTNNVLSNDFKLKANNQFAFILAQIQNNELRSFCKIRNDDIKFEFLSIDDNAKPFQNLFNYIFYRQTTEQQLNQRIDILKMSSNPNTKIPFKEKLYSNDKEYNLVIQWEKFLRQYFNFKQNTTK